MRTYMRIISGLLLGSILGITGLSGSPVLAADDPSIQGAVRKNVQASMKNFIENHTSQGTLPLYDPVEGKLLRLTYKELHSGIVKKGDFYVSCADFVDQSGRNIDVDFLVLPFGSKYRTSQALVHKVNGEKRPYELISH